jgi:hypothetical protein
MGGREQRGAVKRKTASRFGVYLWVYSTGGCPALRPNRIGRGNVDEKRVLLVPHGAVRSIDARARAVALRARGHTVKPDNRLMVAERDARAFLAVER